MRSGRGRSWHGSRQRRERPPADDPQEPRLKAVAGERREESLAARRAELRAGVGFGVEALEGGGQVLAAAGIDDQSGDTVFDDLGGGAAPADAGFAGTHGLEKNQPESLVPAGHREQPARPVQIGELTIVNRAKEADGARDAERRDARFEARSVVPVTDNDKDGVRMMRHQPRPD